MPPQYDIVKKNKSFTTIEALVVGAVMSLIIFIPVFVAMISTDAQAKTTGEVVMEAVMGSEGQKESYVRCFYEGQYNYTFGLLAPVQTVPGGFQFHTDTNTWIVTNSNDCLAKISDFWTPVEPDSVMTCRHPVSGNVLYHNSVFNAELVDGIWTWEESGDYYAASMPCFKTVYD